MVLGVHCELVSSEDPAPELSMMLFFSFTTLLTASATPEFSTSTNTSTLSVSIHRRAIPVAISGLFWWSAETTSIFQPLAFIPESSTAISAATIEPSPPRSAYNPERSVSTPILAILSSAHAPLAAQIASAVPSSSAVILVFIIPPCIPHWGCCLNAEIGVKFLHVGLQLGVGKTVHDLAVLDDIEPVRNGRSDTEILFDQENGEAFGLQSGDGLADLLDDHRGEPLGRLVEHQEPGAGTQDPRDRQHLLLAAR